MAKCVYLSAALATEADTRYDLHVISHFVVQAVGCLNRCLRL